MAAILWCTLLWLCLPPPIRSSSDSTERKLIDHILSNYSKNVRPVTHNSHQMQVSFGFDLRQIIQVDEHDEALETKLWVEQSWTNKLMTWNATEWENISEVTLEPAHLWLPDIVLYNNADDKFNGGADKYKTPVRLRSDGRNKWNSPGVFRSTCSINVRYFPFDRQICLLTFGSWAYPRWILSLEAADAEIRFYKKSNAWDLVEITKEMNVGPHQNHTRDIVTYAVTLTRRPLYYVFNVIFPCLILVVTFMFSFFLPPESGERITLIMTVLLTLSVFLSSMNDSLPSSSDSVPTLGMFLLIVMVEVSISLVTTCTTLTIKVKTERTNTFAVPKWLRIIIFGIIAKLIRFDLPMGKTQRGKFDKFYERRDEENVTFQNTQASLRLMLQRCMKMNILDVKDEREIAFLLPFKTNEENFAVVKIFDELRTVQAAMERRCKLEQNQNDWSLVCQVVDRLIYYAFFVTVISSVFSILVPVYMMYN